MTHVPLSPPTGAIRPFVRLIRGALEHDRATEHANPQRRPKQLAPPTTPPGLWRRWADAPVHEAPPPVRRSSWSLTNARLRASLHR